jgi:tetratricopeptide (TPR) repeat protein
MRRMWLLIAGVALATGYVGLSYSQMGEVSEREAAELEAARASAVLEAQAEEARGVPAPQALAAGEEAYRKGNYDEALARFQAAQRQDPDDAQTALWLGLTYLRMDDPAQAADQWKAFAAKTDDRALAGDVSQHVTILLSEANRRGAQRAIALERQLEVARTDPQTVAVGAFRNLGSAQYAPLGKSMAAMLIDNLQGIEGIRVLEREQVQALVEEAQLAETGLVETGTAVRAGKLLRAGRVTAGSHIDWTSSPTQLKVEALLVEVDDAVELASTSREGRVEEFYRLVPEIATELVPVLARKRVEELPAEQQARVRNEHTRSLPAALAFGRALDAKDRQDGEEAQRQCREAEREDPDFELARRTCGLIPPLWMSTQAVATAVEAQVITAVAAGVGVTPWVVGGLAVAGAAAGGAVAASSGGGGGDGDRTAITEGQGNAPGLQGVPSSASVRVGETLTYNITSNDPDGEAVDLTVQNAPENSTFQQTSGVFTAVFRFSPRANQVNQTFVVTFCASKRRDPSIRTCASSSINVLPEAPPPPPEPCLELDEACGSAAQCCSGQCGPSGESSDDVCCLGVGQSCVGAEFSCCDPGGELQELSCGQAGTCCTEFDDPCTSDADCCSGCCADVQQTGEFFCDSPIVCEG